MRFRPAVLLLWTAWILGSSTSAQTKHLQVIGYYAERHAAPNGDYPLHQLAANGAAGLLTQLDYAFGKVSKSHCEIMYPELELRRAYSAIDSVDGTDDVGESSPLRGTFHQLQEFRKKFPKLKILISLGGWTNSEGFSDAAQPANLREFVRSCVDIYIKGNFAPGIHAPGIFDGIDLDWEYPVDGGMIPGRPEDTKNFNAMAAEFRRQLNAIRPGLLLTAAIPASLEDYKHYDLKTLSRHMDYLSIMAYDLHWNGEKTTNLHSALFHDPQDPAKPPMDKHYGAFAVADFLRAGLAAQKIVLGVPFYGKGWTGVPAANHGLYQSAKDPSKSSPEYRNLKAWPASADRQFYPKLGSCSVWNNHEFFSYDCPDAMKVKRQYARQHGLKGVMFWEMGQDTMDAELLKALATEPGADRGHP